MHERKTSYVNAHNAHRASTTANTTTATTATTATTSKNKTDTTTKAPTPTRRGTKTTTQQRTGRTSLQSATNQQQQASDEQKETQKRIAARAANAMAQVRRRQPRSFMLWGDNKRAVIKRYPDGSQEIFVPQTLTSEQEQYEFPPRSRLLKKLANSTAERHRLSSMQHAALPPTISTSPTSSSAKSSKVKKNKVVPMATVPSLPFVLPPTVTEPDQGALAEWFSGRKQQRNAKEKAVMEWVTDVERSTSLLNKKKPSPPLTKQQMASTSSTSKRSTSSSSSSPAKSMKLAHPNDLHLSFKSEAGKLLNAKTLCQTSPNHLSPPDENTRKHYIRRRRLVRHGNKPPMTTLSQPELYYPVTEQYHPHPHHYRRHHHHHRHLRHDQQDLLTTLSTTAVQVTSEDFKVPRSSVSASPTSKSGMVQLVQMFHKTLQDQQARAHERMKQLETLLEEERLKREDIQRTQQMTMSRLDTFMKRYQQQRTPPSPTLSAASSSSTSTSSPSLVSTSMSPPGGTTTRKQHHPHRRQSSSNDWMERINQLEACVENETKSRQTLQRSVTETVERMDALKRSVSRQAREHIASRRHLEKQINTAMKNLSTLTQQQAKS